MKIAIVGAGWAGERQVQAIRELADAAAARGAKPPLEVACLVDNDPVFLAGKAAELGIGRTFATWREALADPGVEAVSICLPHKLHAAAAIDAARAGRHVICEKPLATSVREADAMLAAAARGGVKLYVAESATYEPRAAFLRDLVATGRHVGELLAVVVKAGFRMERWSYPGRRSWLADPKLGGTGTWMLHGIHTIGAMRYVLGEVRAVRATEHHAADFPTPEVEGTVSALLEMETGIAVSLVQTCESRLPDTVVGYELFGTRGVVRAAKDSWEAFPSSDGGQVAGPAVPLPPNPYPPLPLSPYALELQAFLDCVEGRAEGFTTGESERRTLAVIEAGYRSMRSGKTIRLEG
jgi:predicted dehydrogenase